MNIPPKTPVGTSTVTIPTRIKARYEAEAKKRGYATAELITFVLDQTQLDAPQDHEEPATE